MSYIINLHRLSLQEESQNLLLVSQSKLSFHDAYELSSEIKHKLNKELPHKKQKEEI